MGEESVNELLNKMSENGEVIVLKRKCTILSSCGVFTRKEGQRRKREVMMKSGDYLKSPLRKPRFFQGRHL